jgi:hypothetical protein
MKREMEQNDVCSNGTSIKQTRGSNVLIVRTPLHPTKAYFFHYVYLFVKNKAREFTKVIFQANDAEKY